MTRLVRTLPVLLALGLSAAAQRREQREDDWPRVLPGHELSYPRDHGAHPAYRTEWWYLTGNALDGDGRRFGFQFTVFRSNLDPEPLPEGASPLRARQVYAGHLAVTDVEARRTLFAERLRRASPLAGASEEGLEAFVEGWSLVRGEDGILRVSASDPFSGLALDLELEPAKPFVLHGEDGVSAKGREPGNASAYLSWTRLAARGELRPGPGEDAREVRGSAWFDHEFGSSFLAEGVAGWEWFGLQLDDGRDLMAFRLRREDGSDAGRAGTVVAPDGTPSALGPEDLTLTALATWTSPRTGAEYPSRWLLEVPDHGIRAVVAPLVEDAELAAGGSVGVVYWEGPVHVLPAGGGEAVGRGYAELTGYAGPMTGRF